LKEINARAIITANEQKKSDYLTHVGRLVLKEKSVKCRTENGVSNGSRTAKVGIKTKDS